MKKTIYSLIFASIIGNLGLLPCGRISFGAEVVPPNAFTTAEKKFIGERCTVLIRRASDPGPVRRAWRKAQELLEKHGSARHARHLKEEEDADDQKDRSERERELQALLERVMLDDTEPSVEENERLRQALSQELEEWLKDPPRFESEPKQRVEQLKQVIQILEWLERHYERRAMAASLQVDVDKGEVIFLGDSITQGWDNTGKTAWNSHLAQLKAVNLGAKGDRAEDLWWHLREDGLLYGLKPKMVVLMIGNDHAGLDRQDASQRTTAEVREFLDALKNSLPHTKVLLLPILPCAEDSLRELKVETNILIQTLADGQRVHWPDVMPELLKFDGSLSAEACLPDSKNLSERGYEILARFIQANIQSLLNGGGTDRSSKT